MALLFSDMRAGAELVPAAAIAQGFLDWTEGACEDQPLPGHSDLGVRIGHACGSLRDMDRVSDRVVQKLRKGGFIRLEKRRWILTDRGENLRLAILSSQASTRNGSDDASRS